jgi:hypothetical protein
MLNHKNKSFFAACLLVVGIAGGSNARLTSELSTREMFQAADLVIRGKVSDIENRGRTDVWAGKPQPWLTKRPAAMRPFDFTAQVQIKRLIKGTGDSKVISVHFLVGDSAGFQGLRKGEEALLFLKKVGAEYAFIDPDNGKLPVAEMEAVSAGSEVDSEEARLSSELMALAHSPDSRQASEGLSRLAEFDKQKAAPEIQKQAASGDLEVRALALAKLMEGGDLSVEAEALKILTEAPMNDPKHYATREQRIRNAFSNALWSAHRRHDARMATFAAKLADHPDEILHNAARYAMRGMKSSANIPELLKLLDEPKLQDQYIGVITLCELERKKNCPSIPVFEKNPGRYLQEWKDWGKKRNKQ